MSRHGTHVGQFVEVCRNINRRRIRSNGDVETTFILHSVDLRSMLLKSRVDVDVAPTSQAGSGAVPTQLDHCHIKLVQPLLILLIISSSFTPVLDYSL